MKILALPGPPQTALAPLAPRGLAPAKKSSGGAGFSKIYEGETYKIKLSLLYFYIFLYMVESQFYQNP